MEVLRTADSAVRIPGRAQPAQPLTCGDVATPSPDIGERHLQRLHIMRAMGPPQKEKIQYNVVFTGHAGGELNVR